MRKYYTQVDEKDGYNFERLTMFKANRDEPAPEKKEAELKTFLGVINAALAIRKLGELVEQRK